MHVSTTNNSNSVNFDIAIIGAGISGLSIAYQLIERGITKNIAILEKESSAGSHTSGRNSGVIHAGIYYKPDTLKARVCIKGGERLKKWILERELPYNQCGKIILPTQKVQEKQLHILLERGKKNGAEVELWGSDQLSQAAPYVNNIVGQALWSPNTTVTEPKSVIKTLKEELEHKGVRFFFEENNWLNIHKKSAIRLSSGHMINYGHLFNCAGLYADKIAHDHEVGLDYYIFPFKGLYWDIKKSSTIQPEKNIYPIPDLNVPFLGVHFTPSASNGKMCTIGPTATPSLGRENYRGMQGIEPEIAIRSASTLIKQYLSDKSGFRRYAHEQMLLNLRPFLLREAQKLIPKISAKDIRLSDKTAIRPQLFNRVTQKMEDDFICICKSNTTHVLNTISPAFTASFELADLIINQTRFEAQG